MNLYQYTEMQSFLRFLGEKKKALYRSIPELLTMYCAQEYAIMVSMCSQCCCVSPRRTDTDL